MLFWFPFYSKLCWNTVLSGEPANCSGLLSRDGLQSLSGFVDYRKSVINRIHGADIHLVDQKMCIRKNMPVGFVCDRSVLDKELAANAEHEGARMIYGEKVTKDFRSTNIIGADGPLSAVARHFSMGSINSYATTLQALVTYRSENPHIVEVFLSNRMFPGFFGWVIPHNEETAEFGAGVLLPNNVQHAWEHLFRLKQMDAAKPRGWTIPLEVRSRTAIKKGKYNVLLAGDAAGQVKSTTGGGVVFGGNCAALAGRFAGNPLRYDLEWKMRFGPDLAIHHLIHNYLSSQPEAGLVALGRRLKKLNCDEYLSNHGHMDRPTRMVGPQIVKHVLKNIAGVS